MQLAHAQQIKPERQKALASREPTLFGTIATMSQTDEPQDKRRDTLRPDSPCAGYCSTSHGDEICKGCGRTFDEVLNWIIYDDAEKEIVWARLQAAGLVKR